jgi:hypothetical protein
MGDRKGLAELGERGILDLVMATHAEMTDEDFARLGHDCIESAKHLGSTGPTRGASTGRCSSCWPN